MLEALKIQNSLTISIRSTPIPLLSLTATALSPLPILLAIY